MKQQREELNVQTNIKTANRKELQLQILVDSGYTHIRINKQLVKEKKIRTEPMDRLFKVFNADRTKNREVARFVPLKVKINKYKKQIDAAVMNLNSIDMFLEYDWLVKHKPEVNWNMRTIQFTRCSRNCRIQYQNISFKNRRIQPMDNQDKE